MQAESVLVTGTTSGVGLALLEHYVRSGAQVISVNRRRVQELEARYPRVRFECVDVRSVEAVERLIDRLAEAGELPEVFILNAGINRLDNDESFDLDAYRQVLDTNLYGVLSFVQPITRLPASDVRRHVVAISSMASYVGNPYGLGYATSKRALTACFEAWSRMYAGTDLVFQQVMLGPVPTRIYTMAAELPTWVVRVRDVFSGSTEAAARAIARFATTDERKLYHPWRAIPLYLGMWLGRALLPALLSGRATLRGKPRRRTEPSEARE